MLLLQQRVLTLEDLQPLDLARRPRRTVDSLHSAPEVPVTGLLPPAREHEGMDVQGIGDRLHLHPRHAAQLHGHQLELNNVVVHLPRTERSAHQTPPSVSQKCLLYRGRFSGACTAMLAALVERDAAVGTAKFVLKERAED